MDAIKGVVVNIVVANDVGGSVFITAAVVAVIAV